MYFSKTKLAVLGALILGAAIFAASCSRQGTAASSSGGSSSGSEIVKPERIRVLGNVVNWNENQNSAAWEEAFEKLTGIKVQFIRGVGNITEQINLVWASGDLPDIVEPEMPAMYTNFAANGALYDVTDMFYASPITKDAHLYVADSIKIKGRLYAVPSTHGNGCITYIRQDWLDKLGLKMPTNWNEYYNVMVAFRDQNPAGAGRQSIPFISAGLMDAMYLRDFFPGHNTQPGFFINAEGKVVEGMYDPNTLIGFNRLAQAYRERLIDRESVTNTTTAARDKFYTGNVGMFTYWAGTWSDNLQNNLALNEPAGVVEPMPPIQGTVLIDRPASWTMAIPIQNKNPEGIFKYFIEVAFDRGAGQMLFNHGVEGVHWTREGGTYKKLPDLVNPTRLQTSYIFNPMLTMYPWNDPFPMTDRTTKSINMFNSYAKPDRVMAPDPEIVSIMAELTTARQEIVARIFLGTVTPEEGIAQYRSRYDRQVQQCLTVLNK